MTSRMVTVDLILEVSLRLREWKLFPLTDEEYQLYTNVRMVLNGWARQIEQNGLAVELKTIAENAVEIYRNSEGAALWDRLTSIGDQLIERARELEQMILNRSGELMRIPAQEEIARALQEGEPVEFRDAAMEVTGLKNSTEARNRLKKFLEYIRDWDTNVGSEAWRLLNDVLNENRKLTTAAIELLKNDRYISSFNAVGSALMRRKS